MSALKIGDRVRYTGYLADVFPKRRGVFVELDPQHPTSCVVRWDDVGKDILVYRAKLEKVTT